MITCGLDIKDIYYKIGWESILVSILFAIIPILTIRYKTNKYIKKVDIINIIKDQQKIEENKTGNYVLGIIGLIITPLSLWLFDKANKGIIFRNFNNSEIIFGAMIPIGVYLIVSQIGTLGDIIKKISKKKYYKNIMFYNLLSLKSKQYANTLFTVIALIGITIFFTSLALISSIAKDKIIDMRYLFDYSIRRTVDQNYNMTKDKIFNLASKCEVKIKDYNEIEMLILTRKKIFGNELEMVSTKCLSENEYNRVFNENIDVKPGYYNLYSAAKNIIKIFETESIDLISVGTNFSKKMKMDKGVWKSLIENDSGIRTDFFVLDNADFNKFKEISSKDAVESQIIFNVDNWKNSETFYVDLKNELIDSNEKGLKVQGELIDKIYGRVPEKFVFKKDMTKKDYDSWKYKVESKIAGFAEARHKSIYYILFIYIAVLTIVSSAMILYIKVLNTAWQDNKLYENISLIGANKRYIESIITKQLMIIFFVPTIIGVSLGMFISNMMSSEYLYSSIFKKYSIILALIFVVVQFGMFLFTKSAVIKNSTVYERKLFIKG